MNRAFIKNIMLNKGIRRLIFVSIAVLLFIAAGCSTNRHSSQHYWNRTPASTGHSKCGCILNLPTNHAIKLYQQPIYALQA